MTNIAMQDTKEPSSNTSPGQSAGYFEVSAIANLSAVAEYFEVDATLNADSWASTPTGTTRAKQEAKAERFARKHLSASVRQVTATYSSADSFAIRHWKWIGPDRSTTDDWTVWLGKHGSVVKGVTSLAEADRIIHDHQNQPPHLSRNGRLP